MRLRSATTARLDIPGRIALVLVGLLIHAGSTAPASAAQGWVDFSSNGRWRASRVASPPAIGQDRRFDLADLNGDGKLDFVGNVSGGIETALGNGDGTFQPLQYYGDGVSTKGSFALGDLNNDGKADAVTADVDEGQNTVSAFLGDGAGGFGPRIGSSAGAGQRWIALGDANRDGKLDLAYASAPSGGPYLVGLVPGNGAGGFGLGVSYAESSPPKEISLTDLNGDGKLDLLWIQAAPNQVCYRLGNGDGTFGAATRLKQGGVITDVQTADLNNDGRPDLVWTRDGANKDTTSIALALPAGGFAAPSDIVLPGDSETLALGDFNEDGKIDMISLHKDGRGVYVGRGDGTFDLADIVPPLPVDLAPGIPINFALTNVVVSDLNRDGHLDIVYGLPAADLGNGNGSFGSATTMATAGGPSSAVFAQIGGDANPDLVVACRDSAKASLYINFGNGAFQPRVDFPIGAGAVGIVSADFNNDGWADVVTVNQTANTVSLLLNSQTNGFLSKVDFPVGAGPVALRAADLNADGKMDLIVLNGGAASLSVLIGNGAGSFAPKVDYAVSNPQPTDLVIGDFNNDSKLDVAVAGNSSGFGGILLRMGIGDGTLGSESSIELNKPKRGITAGDFNKDGKLDLAASDLQFQVSTFQGNGDGTFGSAKLYYSTANAFTLESVDFDNDGNLDLALGHSYGYFWILKGSATGDFEAMDYGFAGRGASSNAFTSHQTLAIAPPVSGRHWAAVVGETSNTVTLLRDLGPAVPRPAQAGWLPPQAYATDTDPRGLVVADFNRDGKHDAAAAAAGPNAVRLHLGIGNGAFNPGSDFTACLSIRSVAAADVNRDGKLDAMSVGQTGMLSVLLGDGVGGLGPKSDVDSGGTSHDVAMADLDGNGTLDALVDDTGGAHLKAYSGNGSGGFAAPVVSTLPGGSGCNAADVDIADLNGDGKLDAVVTGGSCGQVSVMIGNGALSFTGTTITMGTQPSHVVVGDFNGDGKPDLVTTDMTNGTVVARMQNPATPGTFLGAATFPALTSPGDITAADVDQDGDLDLLVGSTTQAAYAVLKNNGSGSFGTPIVWSMNDPVQSIQTDDLNHDGYVDVITAGSSANVNRISVRLGTNTVITAVDTPPAPSSYALDQNRPNPFNPVTRIRFATGRPGPVRLRIFDARGRLVSTLVDESTLASGPHEVTWMGKSQTGIQVASGVYFYKLEAGGYTMSKRMVLLK